MIQSIERFSQILSLFSLHKSQLGITEISKRLNLPKGTVQGLVQTMQHEGFLYKEEETRKYRLGIKVYELGIIFAGSLEINNKGIDPAHQLAKETEKLVRLAVLDGNSALITLDVYPRMVPFFSRQVGPRIPLYCTAIGRSLLAFFKKEELQAYIKQETFIQYTRNTKTRKKDLLDDLGLVRKRGYAVNIAENVPGRAAIAAPIFNREGEPIAALSLVISPIDISNDEDEKILSQKVIRAAFEISQKMTCLPESGPVFM